MTTTVPPTGASDDGVPRKSGTLTWRQLLRADGTPLGPLPMTDEQMLETLYWMNLSRVLDARLTSLQRQGRMGTFSAVHGQEAAVVGASMAADPRRDWLVPAYRETPAMIRHGMPLENVILYWRGNMAGGRIPDDVRVLPVQIALAAQLPHAVGLAWGRRLQGYDDTVLTFFGDGASSEGDFHEALNLAGVMSAPVVFLLQNNGWAISTPRHRQTAAEHFALRADGYGMPGVLVDGNDVFAVYQATREAIERARAGGGPTLIELETYRMAAHNTADDPTRYRDEQARAEWSRLDPIVRVVRHLTDRGLWSDERQAALEQRIGAEIDRAVEAADAYEPPVMDQIFRHVYADPPARLRRQRDRAVAAQQEGGQR
ncbi:pyruvate dehydrogenase (acetyl-transferring) E1 component subunit alpha [Streptomyces sp. NPDC093252]|uniref:pyruvate dehydrogenase (acetyl-transferring) E1 component subunit alpha n=1 Tax=Streptomyces sp. NPDC093252 TaxID=3154980 RepID=UPI00341FCCB9